MHTDLLLNIKFSSSIVSAIYIAVNYNPSHIQSLATVLYYGSNEELHALNCLAIVEYFNVPVEDASLSGGRDIERCAFREKRFISTAHVHCTHCALIIYSTCTFFCRISGLSTSSPSSVASSGTVFCCKEF